MQPTALNRSYQMDLAHKDGRRIDTCLFSMSSDNDIKMLCDRFGARMPECMSDIVFLLGVVMGQWTAGKRDMENPQIKKQELTVRSTRYDFMFTMKYFQGH